MRNPEVLAAMKRSMNEVIAKHFPTGETPQPVTLIADVKKSVKGKKAPKIAPEVVVAPEVAAPVSSEIAPEVIAPAEVATAEPVVSTEVTPKSKVKNVIPRWVSDMNGNEFFGVKVLRANVEMSTKMKSKYSDALCPFCQKEFTADSWAIKFGHKTHCGCQKKKKVVETPLAELTEKLHEAHVTLEVAEVLTPF